MDNTVTIRRTWHEWGQEYTPERAATVRSDVMFYVTDRDAAADPEGAAGLDVGEWVLLEEIVASLAVYERSAVRRQCDNLADDGYLLHRRDPDGSLWYALTGHGRLERRRIRASQVRRTVFPDGRMMQHTTFFPNL